MKQLIPKSIRKVLWKQIKMPIINNYERIKYKPIPILSSAQGNEIIAEFIQQKTPAAIGKIGSTELEALVYYQKTLKGYQNHSKRIYCSDRLYWKSGVFPENESIFNNFCAEFLKVLEQMDYLAPWFNSGEAEIIKHYAPNAILSELTSLEPYFYSNPWSVGLENKKVLVIHPFIESIQQQYQRKNFVWSDKPLVLPDFSLSIIKTPLYAGLIKPHFKDWFETLTDLKRQISENEFDIAIIGAGAWSLPLAVYAKNLGKIGIHLGGSTQVLFGIKGGRWEKNKAISCFFNDSWIYPSVSEKPPKYEKVGEGYW